MEVFILLLFSFFKVSTFIIKYYERKTFHESIYTNIFNVQPIKFRDIKI